MSCAELSVCRTICLCYENSLKIIAEKLTCDLVGHKNDREVSYETSSRVFR